MIRFENVHKRYPGGRDALAGVTFSLERGELAFLTGPSGAGKSTLLRLIAGGMRVTGGGIWFDGRDVTGTTEARRAQIRVWTMASASA